MSTENTVTVEELKAQLATVQADAEKWKAFSRKNEDEKKANAEKARLYDELAEKNKSEQEKLAERAERAEKELQSFKQQQERETLAKSVAQEFGIPDSSVLSGSTKEELVAHAEKIKALIPEKPKGAPVGDIAGKRGEPIPLKDDAPSPNDLIRAVARN